MIRLEDLRIFVSAADNGSLSAAARQLDLTPAVASVALKRLETALGTRLLTRSTRSLRLTPDGERYLQYVRNVMEQLEAGRNAVAQGRKVIGGAIALSVPSDLGRNVLLRWLDEFQAQHPSVSLQVRVGDQITDMIRTPVSVAIRYSVSEDSSLVALPLAPDNRRVLCASPGYFLRHGRPTRPADLAEHNCLRFALSDTLHDRWTFFSGASSQVVTVNGDRSSDDGELVRRWAVAGLGIAYKSRLDVLDDLRAGRLEAVLTELDGERAPLHLVCAHRTMLSPTVHALRNMLQQRINGYLA
ncbi:LysR family transcriptional regulator [Xanthomonas campestris pv. trichodesmae]|uniref:LysR family transcriptional regulator n=3 Tax=Xanthomonas citri TaxID=346 RepID=A0AB33CHM7_XANCI|nr:LysR family transcriptional regulator [Xanthomonas citri]ASK92161.1 LysR family transcriptional regulator [Xanthomonas citri pv. vignicola]MBV6782922.1 LysR family transcriptional regulator [Xanthomonas campestris pv. trichodesmae]MBZ3922533.1 LysR family transcriptional regulator [Xanthomonas campestris pv. trichodesmae]MBZ3925408.1 LysR family transcriptional regulator [Xanthomonas citri pv. sesbaniae]